MNHAPMPQNAKDRWTTGFWLDSFVRADWAEPVERWTNKMAELCPTFQYQDIKTKFGSSRVYVSTGIEIPDSLTDEEYEKALDERNTISDQLHAMASEMEAELNIHLI